jgi:hypothetical protein
MSWFSKPQETDEEKAERLEAVRRRLQSYGQGGDQKPTLKVVPRDPKANRG